MNEHTPKTVATSKQESTLPTAVIRNSLMEKTTGGSDCEGGNGEDDTSGNGENASTALSQARECRGGGRGIRRKGASRRAVGGRMDPGCGQASALG